MPKEITFTHGQYEGRRIKDCGDLSYLRWLITEKKSLSKLQLAAVYERISELREGFPETAVLRNKDTNDLYRHMGGDRYKNLRTGAEGEIPPEMVRDRLVLNVDATMILNDYPDVQELVNKLNLKIEKS